MHHHEAAPRALGLGHPTAPRLFDILDALAERRPRRKDNEQRKKQEVPI
jgi:hypothetical protein